jgi:hypothetical protein
VEAAFRGRADGSGKRQLTSHPNPGFDLVPRFLARREEDRLLPPEREWDGGGDYQTGFWTMSPDGSNKAVALAIPEIEDEASWGTVPGS